MAYEERPALIVETLPTLKSIGPSPTTPQNLCLTFTSGKELTVTDHEGDLLHLDDSSSAVMHADGYIFHVPGHLIGVTRAAFAGHASLSKYLSEAYFHLSRVIEDPTAPRSYSDLLQTVEALNSALMALPAGTDEDHTA